MCNPHIYLIYSNKKERFVITLLIGDSHEYLYYKAIEISNTSILLTDENCGSLQYIASNVFFTSLGDISKQNLIKVIALIDKIIYCPPKKWSSNDYNNIKLFGDVIRRDSIQVETELLLEILYNQGKTIQGFTPKYKSLPIINNKHVSKSPQLWFSGASITLGCGVDFKQSYLSILAKKFDMPYTILAEVSSSNQQQASNILLSDIQENDIVIWSINPASRLTFYENKKLHHVSIDNIGDISNITSIIHPMYLDSADILYKNIECIKQVDNFCKKMKATLLIFGEYNDPLFAQYLMSLDNYVQLFFYEEFLDYGSDNIHPGPKYHAWAADNIYQLYQRISS